MGRDSFLGGCLYALLSVESSYLPLHWLCGLVMLTRYLVDAAAFLLFLMWLWFKCH